MERIEPGKYVELGYDLYRIDADGSQELVHQTDVEDPERIVYGVTRGMIAPLEEALKGLTVGDTYDVTVKCDQAFGQHDDSQVLHLDREMFVVDGKFDDTRVKKGSYLPMMTEDGYKIDGLVADVTEDKVIMDFNHPLAGKDVRIAGKVLAVRDATPEEMNPPHGCGGCGGGSCGGGSCGCGDSSCGGGCGCNG
jgi:FKBP-type peptidyl-prolyl cis-trans isomerase SlyD